MQLPHRRSSGYIILSLMLITVMAGTAFLLTALNNRVDADLSNQQEMRYQLDAAKEALLQFAVNYTLLSGDIHGPGYLPCPDTDNDGYPQSTCNASTLVMGRLPEQVGTSEAGDYKLSGTFTSRDEQFWYVVYSDVTPKNTNNYFVYRTAAAPSTFKNLRPTLDGKDNYIALIIAPGSPLEGQDRSDDPTNYTNYLEGGNGSSGLDFVNGQGLSSATANDMIVGITVDELMTAISTQIAQRIQVALVDFYTDRRRFPYSSNELEDKLNSYYSGHPWFARGNQGEYWSYALSFYDSNPEIASSYTVRNFGSGSPTATFSFYGCRHIVFTANRTNVVREGNHCEE